MRARLPTEWRPKGLRFSRFISSVLKLYGSRPRHRVYSAAHSACKSQLTVDRMRHIPQKRTSLNFCERPQDSARTRDLHSTTADQGISPIERDRVTGSSNDHVHDIRACNFDNKVGSRAGKGSLNANPGDAGRYIENGIPRARLRKQLSGC